MSSVTEQLFQRRVVGMERLDGPALELKLACGHAAVHMPTGDENWEAHTKYCKKCMLASEQGLTKLTEALTR